MKEYLIFAAVCLLAGCTTMPPLTEGVTLSLRSYDSATGDYVLELRTRYGAIDLPKGAAARVPGSVRKLLQRRAEDGYSQRSVALRNPPSPVRLRLHYRRARLHRVLRRSEG